MKKTILTLFLSSFICYTQAQNVNIPNTNFLNALITAGVDTSGDNIIQVAEALAVTSISIGSSNIIDLTGIAAFTNLISLACPINGLTSLDVSSNTMLEYLDCGGNPSITSLDLSQNVNLKNLDIIFTGIVSIDLSHNLLLQGLACSGTIYSTFTLKNKLASLDISKNTLLTSLSAELNPNLHSICVNADQFVNRVAGWSKDSACVWDSACVTTSVIEINEVEKEKTPLKIIRAFDILGNEMDPKSPFNKGIIIYQYADGTTKKVVLID